MLLDEEDRTIDRGGDRTTLSGSGERQRKLSTETGETGG